MTARHARATSHRVLPCLYRPHQAHQPRRTFPTAYRCPFRSARLTCTPPRLYRRHPAGTRAKPTSPLSTSKTGQIGHHTPSNNVVRLSYSGQIGHIASSPLHIKPLKNEASAPNPFATQVNQRPPTVTAKNTRGHPKIGHLRPQCQPAGTKTAKTARMATQPS